MPKVKLLDKGPDMLTVWLRAYMAGAGGVDVLAKRMRCSRSTVYHRLKKPMALTLDDLRNIRRATDMPKEELLAQIGKLI